MVMQIYKFDNIKVLCMILVVIAHTLINSYGNTGMEMIRFLCLCYTMPMFAFVSGYFSKPNLSFRKNIITLLVPCVLFTLINNLIELLVNPHYVFTLLMPGFAMWYLWALFVYRVSLPYIIRIPYIVILSFVITWIVGFVPQIANVFSLSRIICFLPYFLLGYKIANSQQGSLLNIRNRVLTTFNNRGGYFLGLIVIFAIWLIFIYLCPGHTYATGFASGYSSVYSLFIRIALQITILLTGFFIICIFPNKELWFTHYGKRTLNVYLLHGIIVLPLAFQIFPPFSDADWYIRIIMILLPTVLCLFFFSKRVDLIMKKILGIFK